MEWLFLQDIIIKIGFAEGWVRKIWDCISSASFTAILNGDPCVDITPKRGLRQGCALSPYLFILCTEGLSSLLSKAESTGSFHGIKVMHASSMISHLFFADDSLLFSKANICAACAVKNILSIYERASGQKINYQKFALSFSPNVSKSDIVNIKNVFGIDVVSRRLVYLGLPSSISRNRLDIFKPMLRRWPKLWVDGRKNFSRRGVRKSLLKLSSNLSHPIL